MRIRLICVGKIKETYLKTAIKDYQKRLQSFCDLEICELKDFSTNNEANESEQELIKHKEGELINKQLLKGYTIALCIEGEMLNSLELAKKIDKIVTYSSSNINIIIGGSYGISESIKNISDYRLSFSKMTFPHQLMRLILLEQVYRSFKIINHQNYHK